MKQKVVVEYQVLSEESVNDLMDRVNQKISGEGFWEPVGGVTFASDYGEYMQAMNKIEVVEL